MNKTLKESVEELINAWEDFDMGEIHIGPLYNSGYNTAVRDCAKVLRSKIEEVRHENKRANN